VAITIDGSTHTTRDINQRIKAGLAAGERDIRLLNPDARHNLAVALLQPGTVTLEGSAGYYCGGLMDGATVRVRGSVGWGAAESMLTGTLIVDSHAGSGAAAAIRGGTVVIRGDAAARAGVSMKGGTLLIGGDCGPMAGFMMQKGRLIICGDAGDALADSMYEGVVYVGGRIHALGNDAVTEEPTPTEQDELQSLCEAYEIPAPKLFRKVVAGRKLWNFDRKESLWKVAL
jgi:glutamate synthase domain-containing protein 3